MKTPEEIAYEAGRHALADQEALVSGIRQRAGTLLAAHALVASFLGAGIVRSEGLHAWGWVAMCALVAGLIVAAALLVPWRLSFAVDARGLYAMVYERKSTEAVWLVEAGLTYQQLRDVNSPRVRAMSGLLTLLGHLSIVQTLAWMAELVG